MLFTVHEAQKQSPCNKDVAPSVCLLLQYIIKLYRNNFLLVSFYGNPQELTQLFVHVYKLGVLLILNSIFILYKYSTVSPFMYRSELICSHILFILIIEK